MATRISQREAHKLRKRVASLEQMERDRANAYQREYPGGIHVESIPLTPIQYAKLYTTRRLGFALVGTVVNRDELTIYALPSKIGE